MGQQCDRFSFERLECAGKVKALHLDVSIAAQAAFMVPAAKSAFSVAVAANSSEEIFPFASPQLSPYLYR